MLSLSQKNLMKLAQKNQTEGNVEKAIQNLEEALREAPSSELIVELSKLYRQNKMGDQAYALIKSEPDLFSNKMIFNEYCKVLKENNFRIEALQLENLLNKKLPISVTAVDLTKQRKIMNNFTKAVKITQALYEQLLKLDSAEFVNFSQSLLLNPTLDFAVRLALCEDLVKLGISQKIKVWILENQVEFVPDKTQLLEQSSIYHEAIAAIGSRFKNNPSQLPLMLGEINLVLGSLYPKLTDFISNPDSFVKDLLSFLQTGQGYAHQELFKKIYNYLPK